MKRLLELLATSFDFLWDAHPFPDDETYSITHTACSSGSTAIIIENSSLRMQLVDHMEDYSIRIEPSHLRSRGPWLASAGTPLASLRYLSTHRVAVSGSLSLSQLGYFAEHLPRIEAMMHRQNWPGTQETLRQSLPQELSFINPILKATSGSSSIGRLQVLQRTSHTPKSEVELMDRIAGLDIGEISDNINQFKNLIFMLTHSHTITGSFDMTKSDEPRFLEFSRWLKSVDRSLDLGLEQCVEDLSVTYDDMTRAYPSLLLAPGVHR